MQKIKFKTQLMIAIILIEIPFSASFITSTPMSIDNSHVSMRFPHQNAMYDYEFIWETYENASGDLPGDDILVYGQSLGEFHNYTEQILKYESLEANFPDYVEIFSIGTTFLGFDIYCVKLTDESVSTNKDEVLIVAQHHALEQITVENALYFIDKTLDNVVNHQDTESVELLRTREIYIIPSLNVDGSLLISKMPWHRKTVRGLNLTGGEKILSDLASFVLTEIEPRDLDGDGYISAYYDDAAESTWSYSAYEGLDLNNNSNIGEDVMGGTDPNRNYDFGHGNPTFSSDVRGSQVYHGGEPFTENCTQALSDFIDNHTFKTAVSLHSGIEMIYYPYINNDNAKLVADVGTSYTVRTTLQEILGFPAPAQISTSGLFTPWNYFAHLDNRITICLETYGNTSAIVVKTNETTGISQEKGIWDFCNPAPNQVIDKSENIFAGLHYLAAFDFGIDDTTSDDPTDGNSGIPGYSWNLLMVYFSLTSMLVINRKLKQLK